MKCVICKDGETRRGTATITLEREAITVVFKSVPADVCSTCGEEYVDDKTTAHILDTFEEAIRTGVVVDVRQYSAA